MPGACALQTYLNLVGPQHQCLPQCGGGPGCRCTVNCLRFLYTAAASDAGLWCQLYRRGLVYDFGFGSVEPFLNPYASLPLARFVVGADAGAVTWPYAPNFPTTRLSRLQFLARIARTPICVYGTWTQPSLVRSQFRLRSVVPSDGASIYDGVPFAVLAANGGLLDAEGYVEVASAAGPLGSALLVQRAGLAAPSTPASLFGSQQLLVCYDGKGGNLAVRCDPARTLVALNKTHAAVLLTMQLQGLSFQDAVVYFVDVVCGQSTSALALDPLFATTTWQTYFTQPAVGGAAVSSPWSCYTRPCASSGNCCYGQDSFLVLGNSDADGPTMWQQVVATTGIASLTNPTALPANYTLSDVAQVFVQCLCTPDFLVRTSDPWARLAAFQSYYLGGFCDVVIGEALGAWGTPTGLVDLVQCLFEYQGDTFNAELVYAWWRYCSYTDLQYASSPVYQEPPLPPGAVTSVTGPFYARSSANAWNGLSYTQGGPEAPTGEVQINVAYAFYALAQLLFPDAPLSVSNPCGGRWPYLGLYDVAAGSVASVTQFLWGPALGGLFPTLIQVGAPAPAALPGTVGAAPAPVVPFLHPFFVVSGAGAAGTPANAGGDPNMPATVVFDGDWLVYDAATTPKWTATPAWPTSFAAPTAVWSSVVASQPYMKTVYEASCLWDRTVPPSAAGLEFAENGQAWMAPG